MITSEAFRGKHFAVMGLGKSGVSASRALLASGARVYAFDDTETTRTAAAQAGLPVCDVSAIPEDGDFWGTLDGVVWSPGIPSTYPQPHPVALLAKKRGIPLFCDIDLLVRAHPGNVYVGITGTNGKSTTTALIGHILGETGSEAEVGGNLGRPVMDFTPLGPRGTYVLELSSYQLELVPSLDVDVGILLNITPDHLSRHGGFDGYVAAKETLFAQGARPRTALIGVDDTPSQQMFQRVRDALGARAIPISGQFVPEGGIGVRDGKLIDATDGGERIVLDLSAAPALPGSHNAQNIAAAWGAARALCLSPADIAKAICSFPGLAHRQELVATINGVRFINDSKATNADASEKALSCYDAVYWIGGGLPKEGGITSLSPLFSRIRQAFLIGQCAPQFYETLDGQVTTHLCETLDRAVEQAAKAAFEDGIKDAVVLLSPAAASWDQFRSFEHRGDVFRTLVEALAAGGPK